MLVVFFRALILFSVVFIVIRLMGKRELSKVQPFELAIIVMISDLASGPMSSRDMQIFSGIIPIVAMLIIYSFLTMLIRSHNKVQGVLCGNPALIIFKGKIIEEEFKNQHMTIEEIMSQLRTVQIYKIQDAAYAILETNGKLNAVKSTDVCGQMPLNIITDGQYLEKNMQILKMSKEEVDKLLSISKIELKKVLVGTINEKGIFEYQLKEEKK